MIRAAYALVFLFLTALAAHAGDDPYVRPSDIDLLAILAPAPAPDSAITREDLRILLDLQATRTPEMVAMANADVQRTLQRFSQVVGTDLSTARAPKANALVDKATADSAAIFLPAKAKWQRLRPYVQFPQIKLVVPPEDTYSYPSGHAAFGMGTAILLALSAVAMVAMMMRNPAFQDDLKAARAEVRSLLNLPPLPQDALPALPSPSIVPTQAEAPATAK
ncbi:MAG: hypothetical protein B7Z30_06740 [Rhizobiales bacterium 12-68-15]|nr:MAG: hypothetical protein B7Z30_06740 [Rhizobiales bacterium 12-68-15]